MTTKKTKMNDTQKGAILLLSVIIIMFFMLTTVVLDSIGFIQLDNVSQSKYTSSSSFLPNINEGSDNPRWLLANWLTWENPVWPTHHGFFKNLSTGSVKWFHF